MGATGGIVEYYGAKRQIGQQQQAMQMQEHARQQAMGMMSNDAIMQAFNTYFPGIFDTGQGGTGTYGGPSFDASQPWNLGGTDQSLGSLAVESIRRDFMDQGVSPVAYERAQEQANLSLNTALRSITGGLTGRGIDPTSGAGQSFTQGAVLQNQFARNEAARDYTLMEEQMRDQRTQQAMSGLTNVMSMIFGLQGQKANVAQGQPVTPVSGVNPYSGIARGVASTEAGLGDWLTNAAATGNWGWNPSASAGGSA